MFPTNTIVYKKLRELELRVLEASQELESKRSLNDKSSEGLPLLGKKVSKNRTNELLKGESLIVSNTWVKKHNSKWVFGASILNTSKRHSLSHFNPVVDDTLHSAHNCILHLHCGEAGQWRAVKRLLPEAQAYVFIVVDGDKWPEDGNMLRCALGYKVEGGEVRQVEIPPFPTQTPLDKTLLPFSQQGMYADVGVNLLIVTVTSVEEVLIIKVTQRDFLFKKALTRGLGFEKVSATTLYHRGAFKRDLCGVMVQAKKIYKQTYMMQVHARDVHQVESLIVLVRSVLPVGAVVATPALESHRHRGNGVDVLTNEMRYVVEHLDKWRAVEEVEREEYSEFREGLAELEVMSDLT